MKYKAGDTVTILPWEELKAKFCTDRDGDLELNALLVFPKDKKIHCGEKITIEVVLDGTVEYYGGGLWFTPECIMDDPLITTDDLAAAKDELQIERLEELIKGGCRVREIKFRLRIKDRETGSIHIMVVALVGVNSLTSVPFNIDDFEIVSADQFTGLRDKNGKEIFENDILKCVSEKIHLMSNKPTGEIVTKIKTIEWQEEWARFHLKNPDGMFELLPCTKQEWIAQYYEVIGNIYEPPRVDTIADKMRREIEEIEERGEI